MKKRIILFLVLFMSSVALKSQTIMNIYQNTGTVVQIPLNSIDSITYTILSPSNLPTLTTLPITNITSNTASSGGNITNDGGTPITQKGIVWSTSPNPTTADNITSEGSGTGSFSSEVTGLTEYITYYLRAYATNGNGTAYGNELSFFCSTNGDIISNPGTGVTFDGYTYSSIVLGNGQEWMAENLTTTVYANGDPIPNITDSLQWGNLTTGAWVHYNNESQYENPYGKLYSWYTIVDPRNVCPTDWHVPSNIDWMLLTNYLGGESIAGGKMKSTGTQFWGIPNINATNESGFSGLPGGVRIGSGSFGDEAHAGWWWSSTEHDMSYGWGCRLFFEHAFSQRHIFEKNMGFSVRCIKD
jgi:uncharacterized protein (TIGR02145 family)